MTTDALALVDAALAGRAVVSGSLPPEGRDLDVLVAPADLPRVTASLAAAGFVRRGGTWARFRPGLPPELVDPRPALLPAAAREALFAGATPLEGCLRLCRPEPAAGLLLLARAVAADGRLTDRRRARATSASPDDWRRAREQAAEWQSEAALTALERALAGAPPAPGLGPRARGRLRGVRRAGAVAISGLDGAGKSTQAALVRDTLEAIGIPAAVEWNRLAHDRWLDAVARPVKRLGRGGRADTGRGRRGGSTARDGLRSSLWVVVVALANALAHLRSVLGHRAAGVVVVCDRYVLDSVVHLRESYRPGPGLRAAVLLVRLLSPRPRCAFLLDVAPDALSVRKPQRLSADRLAARAAYYRAEAARLGVRRLDGERPAAELVAEIAREVWLRL